MRYPRLSAAILLGSTLLAATAGAQTGTLDQTSPFSGEIVVLSGNTLQQQVRAGLSGTLEGFELELTNLNGASPGDVDVVVRVGDVWNAGPVAWSTTHLVGATLPAYESVFFDVSSASIALNSGDTFVIEVSWGGAGFFPALSGNNTFPPGYAEPLGENGGVLTSDLRLGFNSYMTTGGSTTSFSGTITDCTTLAPLNGATVDWGAFQTTTDITGFYSFSGLPCSTDDVVISLAGYQTKTVSSYTPACNTSNTLDECLDADSTSFSGTITDCTTLNPLSGATVDWGAFSATTDVTGFYSLSGLPCETNDVVISLAGHQTKTVSSYTPTCNAGNTLDECLEPDSTSFSGTITDCVSLAPLNGATVDWGAFSTTTDVSGFYSFTGLPCETNDVVISLAGYETKTVASYTPACNSSSTLDECLEPDSAEFSGTITDCVSLAPLDGALVTWGGFSTTTDITGFYSLSGLPCQTNDVVISLAGYDSKTVSNYTPACNGASTLDECLDPSSGGPVLSVSNLAGGQTATFSITGAPANAKIIIAYSIHGTGPTNVNSGPPCGVLTLDLSPLITPLPRFFVDGTGAGSLDVAIPGFATGKTVYLQAAEFSSCQITNLLTEVVL